MIGLYRNREYALGDKVVIMAFPGSGKSDAVKQHPDVFTEINAEDYELGDVIGMPDVGKFPKNYVDEIENRLEDCTDDAKIVLVSAHPEVAEELASRGIKFCFARPSNKKVMLRNCIRPRTYIKEFIRFLYCNYDDMRDRIYRACSGPIILMLENANLERSMGNMPMTYRHIIHKFNGGM